MSKLNHSQEKEHLSQLPLETASNEAEQILHLKRLLVTLKQHYEKNLHTSVTQLEAEQTQRTSLEKEFEKLKLRLVEEQKAHEEELIALRDQQKILKELLHQAQDQLALDRSAQREKQKHIEQDAQEFEKLRNSVEELRSEKELLREALDQSEKKHRCREEEFLEHKKDTQIELEELRKQIVNQQQQEIQQGHESLFSSHPLRHELEMIKETLMQGSQETKAIEARYIEILNEKVGFEHQIKQYQIQIEQELDLRMKVEAERDQIKIYLEESEGRLKVSQQHLAKKVKEAALLSEKVEEQQLNLTDFLHTVEHQKTELTQLHASIEFYQKQEQKFQQQLHDALKGSESQAIKWEEKYFQMCDKWQESENQIRELKKFEEKHQQMQNLLANLGNFMGNSLHASATLFQTGPSSEEISVKHLAQTSVMSDEPSHLQSQVVREKYDLFGLRQTQEKYDPQHNLTHLTQNGQFFD